MKSFLRKISANVRTALRERSARKRAIKKGNLLIPKKLVERIESRIEKRFAADNIEDAKRAAFAALGAKKALDKMGIINTKRDPTKRQRILKIWERLRKRESLLKALQRKNPEGDILLKQIIYKLKTELGGRRKFYAFLHYFEGQ